MSVDSATPSTRPSVSSRKRKKARRAYFLIGAIVVAIGFLVFQGLGNATEYFKTTDEAVSQQRDLGDRRFRLEGVVAEGTVCTLKDGNVRFHVEGNGKTIEVRHDGSAPELFRENVPVVVSGSFDRTTANPAGTDAPTFRSDLVMIKHDENYVEANSDRVKDYAGRPDAPKPERTIRQCAAA